ncbi:NADH-ubiquinone oxidoreductase chain 6-like [Bidens hawaiensis]|uniref:NADH-ubiquinone oxidoreductase chain 6-like n=1 Tax=Bidens hawaiensis TaxID=980011 RepID=UPI0040495883
MILSVLSSLALVSGLMVVRAKNPVHSVLFPIPVFRNTSGLLLLLGLDFFAMIFPVVHIGAIAVSFLFVVMMFHIQIAEIHEEVLHYLPVSGIIGLIFWWEMFFILDNESIPLLPTQRNTTSLRYMVYAGKVRSWTNLETLGNLLYTYYSVWFLVPSLILLVAMIGAIVLTISEACYSKESAMESPLCLLALWVIAGHKLARVSYLFTFKPSFPTFELVESTEKKTFKDVIEGLKVIGAGTATIALAGAAVGIGKIFSFALTEAIALFALMMAFLILFVF